MKSVRLDPVRAERLKRAAKAEGISESEFIRRALDRAVDQQTQPTLYELMKDVIGIGDLGGGVAHRTGEAFTELLVKDWERQKREWLESHRDAG